MKYKLIPGLLVVFILLLSVSSCKYFRSDHPQADILTDSAATGINEKSILTFAAGVDRDLAKFKKEYSLIYTSGDLKVYTEKYSDFNNGQLYRIHSINGSISSAVKSYYLKADSLIHIKEKSKFMNQGAELFRDSRTYLRNGVVFAQDNRTANSAEALRTLPFLAVTSNELKFRDDHFQDELESMNDALMGKDKFEMVFDHLATYPDARYIVLRSKSAGNFTATVLVREKDRLIDSLLNSPEKFKDGELRFQWKIEDQDAVYVPVSNANTSASGLNK